jgi:DNA-binding NtrC family response regulator
MRIANVLLVDDDTAVCRIVHRMLSDDRHKVQTCQTVADALEVIEQKPFDIFVMDYKLPDGSGLDVAERIRSKWGAVPIILISGYDPSDVASTAAKLQISDFLEKPFSRQIICNAVEKAIGLPVALASESVSDRGKGLRHPDFVPRRLAEIKQAWRTLKMSRADSKM